MARHADTSIAPAEKFKYPSSKANESGFSAVDWETFGIKSKAVNQTVFKWLRGILFSDISYQSQINTQQGWLFLQEENKRTLFSLFASFFLGSNVWVG
jgi:hypothetical protein